MCGEPVTLLLTTLREPGDSEIHHFQETGRVNDQILRLDVAVNYSLVVRHFQSATEVLAHGQSDAHGQLATLAD